MTTIGSGGAIDVNGIVSQLMTVEQAPLTAIKKTLSGIQTKLSAMGRLQSSLSAFQTAAKALMQADAWDVNKATSSDEAAVKATAGSGAITGVYDLVVNRLAQRQTLASPSLASATTVVGGGTLRIQLGTYDSGGNTFTAKPDTTEASITIAADSTLEQVRDAINAADAGVSASIVNDGAGVRLLVRGNDTGAANAVRILADDLDGNATDTSGLSRFAFDPTAAAGAGKNLTQTQAAQDAELVVSGLTVTSASNKVTDVIENVTLDLRRAGPGAVNIDVSSDTDKVRKSVEKFVTAWNDLNKTIADLTRYDPATKAAGTLQGNNSVTTIQRQVRALMQGSVEGSPLSRLSEAGLELQRDGSLQIKDTRFAGAAADPDKLKALFSTFDGDPARTGIARRLDDLLTEVLGAEGAITGANDSLNARKKSVERQQSSLEDRLTLIEARLRKQYTTLDSNLSKMGSSSSYLANFFS